MQKFKALLTDLDGTLIHSQDCICEALRHSFLHVGVTPPAKEEILNMFGLPVEVMLVQLTAVTESETERIEQFIAEYKRQYPVHMINAKLITNAKETLELLSAQSYPICLITSERRKNAEHILQVLGLDRLINNIISRDEVEHFKPHPEPLLKAVELLGLEAKDCAYIGESPFDIQAGVAAGVYVVGVPSGNWTVQSLIDCKPDIIIDDIKMLVDIMNG